MYVYVYYVHRINIAARVSDWLTADSDIRMCLCV